MSAFGPRTSVSRFCGGIVAVEHQITPPQVDGAGAGPVVFEREVRNGAVDEKCALQVDATATDERSISGVGAVGVSPEHHRPHRSVRHPTRPGLCRRSIAKG